MAERRRDSAAASLAAMRSFTLSAALSASALMRFTSSCRQYSQSLHQQRLIIAAMLSHINAHQKVLERSASRI